MKKKLLASALSATILISTLSPITASALTKNYYSFNKVYSGSTRYATMSYNKSYDGGTITYRNTSPQKITYNYKNDNYSTTKWKTINFDFNDYFSTKANVPSESIPDTISTNTEEQKNDNNKTTNTTNNQTLDKGTVEKQTPTVSASNKEFEAEVIRLVNIERQKAGLNPLAENVELSKVARIKSQDMRDKGYFSHTSPTYGSPFDMIKQFGLRYMAAGENIAKGQRTPESVVTAWMNSDGHRRNILSTNFTEIGVGYVVDSNGTTYWTQMFIKPRN